METMNDPKQIDKAIFEAEQEATSIRLAITGVETAIKSLSKYSYYEDRIERHKKEREELLEKLPIAVEKVRKLNALYTGWTRAFLVVNSNGHIHKNRACSTCFVSTQYYWLTELSGDDEITIVEKAGEKACTVCYPDAPSEYFLRASQLEHPDVKKAREEREAKKAEREAKRLRVGIFNADGTPLRTYATTYSKFKSEIKTERTASSLALEYYLWLSPDHSKRNPDDLARVQEAFNDLIEALARKRGTSFETERDAIEIKGLKKQIQNAKELAKWYEANPQYKPEGVK